MEKKRKNIFLPTVFRYFPVSLENRFDQTVGRCYQQNLRNKKGNTYPDRHKGLGEKS